MLLAEFTIEKRRPERAEHRCHTSPLKNLRFHNSLLYYELAGDETLGWCSNLREGDLDDTGADGRSGKAQERLYLGDCRRRAEGLGQETELTSFDAGHLKRIISGVDTHMVYFFKNY